MTSCRFDPHEGKTPLRLCWNHYSEEWSLGISFSHKSPFGGPTVLQLFPLWNISCVWRWCWKELSCRRRPFRSLRDIVHHRSLTALLYLSYCLQKTMVCSNSIICEGLGMSRLRFSMGNSATAAQNKKISLPSMWCLNSRSRKYLCMARRLPMSSKLAT